MRASGRLAGHGLRNEGRVYDAANQRVAAGSSRCECGESSPELPSQAARQRWHERHKERMRAQAEVAPDA